MSLLAAYSTEAEIPEEVKDHYTKQGDVFVLAVKPAAGWGIDKVAEIKNKLAEAITTRDAAKGKLKAFGEITPEQATEALAAAAKFKDLDPEKDAEKKAELKAKAIIEAKSRGLSAG